MSHLEQIFRASQIITMTNCVVVLSAGKKRVDYIVVIQIFLYCGNTAYLILKHMNGEYKAFFNNPIFTFSRSCTLLVILKFCYKYRKGVK